MSSLALTSPAYRAQLCQDFCKDIPTDQLSMTLEEYVCKQAFLQGMSVNESTLQLNITGLASQMLASAFAGQFVGSGATNFLELSFQHLDVGRFTVTMQKVSGKTPGQLKSEAAELAEQLEHHLRELVSTSNDNTGHEPSLSVFQRAVDQASEFLDELAKAAGVK